MPGGAVYCPSFYCVQSQRLTLGYALWRSCWVLTASARKRQAGIKGLCAPQTLKQVTNNRYRQIHAQTTHTQTDKQEAEDTGTDTQTKHMCTHIFFLTSTCPSRRS